LREIDTFCLIGEREVNRRLSDRGEVFKNCILRAPVEKVSGRGLNSLTFGADFLNRDDSFGGAVRQTSQEHAIDDAEDRRACTDAECESDDDDRSEARMLQQSPHAVANIFNYRIHNLFDPSLECADLSALWSHVECAFRGGTKAATSRRTPWRRSPHS